MWLCKLFGHKFIKGKAGWNYRARQCWRCGYSPSTSESGDRNG